MISRLFVFLFMLLFLVGCCKQTDLNLPATMQAWSPYKSGEEITFANATGENLTFRAQQRTFNQNGQDKVCGDYDIETQETILIWLPNHSFTFRITLSHEVLVTFKTFYVSPTGSNLTIQFNTVAEQYVSDDWRDKYIKSKELNGKVYQNVLHFFGTPSAHTLALAEVYYAREKGLVAFKPFNGDWYYLQ